MKDLAGKSIQTEGRALHRQEESWFVQQIFWSSGKLERRAGGEKDWEKKQGMSKGQIMLPLDSPVREN